jgi:Uma2 family endonuclease
MSTVVGPMTTEEMLALPDDGVERWLIAGELRERPMTVRNHLHSAVLIRLGFELEFWRRQQPPPRGDVVGGEAGVRLHRDPETTVGVDVAYVSPDVLARQTGETTLIEGIPLLVVEILSPSDTLEDTTEKTTAYLNAGVPLVWVINPYDRTVTVYRPGALPEMVNEAAELSGDPHLPGLRFPVRRLFE